MLILRQSGLARRLVSTQGPNVFTASATERLSPFSGAIWDETVKHFGYDIETRQSPDEYELTRKPRRYEMRGGNHLVRTHWWLAQGDFFIKQIAAVNIEYITPSYDQYGASSGLQGFVTNIVPQLRFKNQHVVITTNRNEAATPYIQFFFKDGREAMVNCYKTSMEDIVAHLRTTFYAKPGTSPYDENDEYDADGRLTNPFIHVQNKPCSTSLRHRQRRKCLCQQPGQLGCRVDLSHEFEPDNRKYYMRHMGSHIPMGDSYAMERWQYQQIFNCGRNKDNKIRKADMPRPTQGADAFREYMDLQIDQEDRQAAYMGDKVKMSRHFRHVRNQNQKWVHLYWSEWFWNVDSGLSEQLDEVEATTRDMNNNLVRDIKHRGARQKHPRGIWRFGIPWIS